MDYVVNEGPRCVQFHTNEIDRQTLLYEGSENLAQIATPRSELGFFCLQEGALLVQVQTQWLQLSAELVDVIGQRLQLLPVLIVRAHNGPESLR